MEQTNLIATRLSALGLESAEEKKYREELRNRYATLKPKDEYKSTEILTRDTVDKRRYTTQTGKVYRTAFDPLDDDKNALSNFIFQDYWIYIYQRHFKNFQIKDIQLCYRNGLKIKEALKNSERVSIPYNDDSDVITIERGPTKGNVGNHITTLRRFYAALSLTAIIHDNYRELAFNVVNPLAINAGFYPVRRELPSVFSLKVYLLYTPGAAFCACEFPIEVGYISWYQYTWKESLKIGKDFEIFPSYIRQYVAGVNLTQFLILNYRVMVDALKLMSDYKPGTASKARIIEYESIWKLADEISRGGRSGDEIVDTASQVGDRNTFERLKLDLMKYADEGGVPEDIIYTMDVKGDIKRSTKRLSGTDSS